MPLNLILFLITTFMNVAKTPSAAVNATAGLAAGATMINKLPTTPIEWVVVIAGAIGMIANAIHANALALQREPSND